jgi:hypothetical protein
VLPQDFREKYTDFNNFIEKIKNVKTKVDANRDYGKALGLYLTGISVRLDDILHYIPEDGTVINEIGTKIKGINEKEEKRYNLIESPYARAIQLLPPTGFQVISEDAVFKYRDEKTGKTFNIDESVIPGVPNNYLDKICQYYKDDTKTQELTGVRSFNSFCNSGNFENDWKTLPKNSKKTFIDTFRKAYKDIILDELNNPSSTINSEIFDTLPKGLGRISKSEADYSYQKDKTKIESYFDTMIKNITDITDSDTDNGNEIIKNLEDKKKAAIEFLDRHYTDIYSKLSEIGFKYGIGSFDVKSRKYKRF